MSEIPPGHRPCPHCAELIRAEARLCRFCGAILDEGPAPRRIQPMAAAGPLLLERARSLPVPELTLGDRRIATVFFFDIEGFTQLAERIDPEEVQTLLNEFFAGAIAIIEQYDGTVDNIIGDEILAVFGVPVAHENDPDLALRAACDLLDYVRSLNRRRQREVHIHGGIHTGLVVTGELGSMNRSQFSLVGATVNLASRLTGAAGRDEILVSFETHEQTGEQFLFESAGALTLKGIAAPQRTYRLIGLNPLFRGIAPPPRAIRSPFVGRGPEMEALRAFLQRPGAGGRCPGFLVRGEMGLGKTRLVLEAVGRHARMARFHRGAAAAWARSVSLFALIDLLRQIADVGPEDSPPAVRRKVEAFAAVLQPAGELDVLALCHLLGDASAVETLGRESHANRQRRLFLAMTDLCRALSARRPLVLFFDDVQWLDPTTWRFLRELAGADGLSHCWLILGAREDAGDLDLGRPVEALTLTPLSDEDSRILVAGIFDQIGIRPELQRLILRRGEGNPLYIEELAHLIEGELLGQPPQAQDLLADRLRQEIPQALQGLIQARIDRLEIKTRLVLQCGAVLGREFLFDVLALIELLREGLMARLLTLEALQILLRRVDERFLKYYFRNSLTQEVVYRSMLRRQREQLHETVAAALEQLGNGRPREYAAQVAFHWEQAGDISRACVHLVLAGRRALDLGDLRLAALHVDSVLQRLPDQPSTPDNQRTLAEALLLGGVVHRLAGKLPESRRLLRLALHTARLLEDGALAGRALLLLADTLQQQGCYRRAERLGRRALAMESAANREEQATLCRLLLGITAWQQGRLDEAASLCRAAARSPALRDRPGILSDAFNNLGLVLWNQSKLGLARSALVKALRLRQEAGLLHGEVITETNLGIIAEQMGEFREAQERAEHALMRAEALDFRRAQSALHTNLASLELLRQSWQGALEHSARAEAIAREIGDRRSEAIALENRALAEIGLGELEAADASEHRARELAQSLEDRERLVSLHLCRVAIELARSDAHSAQAELGAARDGLREGCAPHLQPALLQRHAAAARAAGDLPEARRALLEALRLSRRTKQQADELRVLRDLAGGSSGLAVSPREASRFRTRLRVLEEALA